MPLKKIHQIHIDFIAKELVIHLLLSREPIDINRPIIIEGKVLKK